MKDKLIEYLHILTMLIITWIAVSTIIQSLLCPELTQMQLFLHIPKSFICSWEY